MANNGDRINPMPEEKLFNRNFVLLCLSNMCTGLTFFMVVPVLALYLTQELGASKALAGIIIAVHAVAALLIRPFSGLLVDRFQRKPLMLLALAGHVVASLGYIFFTNLAILCLFRFAQGAVFSISSTAVNTAAVDNIPRSKLGTGIGLFGVLLSLSMALAPMFGIMLHDRYSSRLPFIASSCCALLSLIFASFLHSPRREIAQQKPGFSLDSLFLKSGALAVLCYGMTMFGYGLLANYVSLLAAERGFVENSGFFFMFLSCGMVLSRLFAGAMLDRGRLRQAVLIGYGFVLTGVTVFVAVQNPFIFLFSGLVLGVGYGCCMPSFQALLLGLARPDQTGTANSTFYLAMDISIGMAAFAGGLIADQTSLSFTYSFGGMLALGACLLFGLRVKPR